jgi:hypothetical protein
MSTLEQFKQAGKKFVDTLKDPSLSGPKAREAFQEFCAAYLAVDLNDERAKVEAPIVYRLIAKEWLAYGGPRGILL